MKIRSSILSAGILALGAGLIALPSAAIAAPKVVAQKTAPKEVARDVSPPLKDLAKGPARQLNLNKDEDNVADYAPEREHPNKGAAPGSGVDNALQNSSSLVVDPPIANFEGISNQDNFNIFGFRVNPPDPVGAVGPNHYVEMVNLAFAVYDKSGNVLTPPTDIGALWAGFAITDCTDPSGDPIVLYDQFMDRWVLSQFTTAGPTFYNCIAISQTSDPTGAYYRYAFSTGANFPDYPKYGNWTDSYVITTREFGPIAGFAPYGIGVYALEKNKMVNGLPARAVGFFLEGIDSSQNATALLPLVGDGLLPAYVDGKQKPKATDTIPIVGTQDNGGPYGATFDALNIFDLTVKWNSTVTSSLVLNTQLPVASFDSIFPCAPTSRDCLPQPGITNPAQYLDILSYRQRPTWRLAYRNFKTYDAMVTSQSVEASPGIAGMRWYEIRRSGGTYSVYQQGTYSPDSVHRWMGSVSQDFQGNIGLAYSVVDGTSVFPGIRYTGRLAGDALGQMTLGEGTIINGTGVQRTTNSRWGDYTSLNPDPVDDCTLWFVNEYYTLAGQISSTAGWQTRIASFKLPGCVPLN